MTVVSFPETTINLASNTLPISTYPHKVLFVGQKLSSGSKDSGELVTNIPDDISFETYFGKASMLSGMIRAARKINKETRFDAIALDDNAGGTKAKGAITFSGTATIASTLHISVGSFKNHTYQVDVLPGDTALDIANDIKVLVDADLNKPFTCQTSGIETVTVGTAGTGYSNSFAVTATGGGGTGFTATATATGGAIQSITVTNPGTGYTTTPTIVLTAGGGTGGAATAGAPQPKVNLYYNHKGLVGNKTGIRINGSVTGITSTLTAFSGGATNPVLTDLFDVVDGERYNTIIWPFEYGTTAVLDDFLDDRFNVTDDVLDGVAVMVNVDSYINHITILNALNSQSSWINNFTSQNTSLHKGIDQLEFTYIHAAKLGAIRALRLTSGTNLSSYVVSNNGSLDYEGGPALATLPYANTPVPDSFIPEVGVGFTKTQVINLRTAGGSIIGANSARNGVVIGEAVTTYKTDGAGNPDTTFKYLNDVDASSIAREYFFNNIKNDFSQTRLTSGDPVPGRVMYNEAAIKAKLVEYYSTLSGDEWVITQGGAEAVKFFKDNLTVSIDFSIGKVNITMVVPIVRQVRSFNATMKIDFSIGVGN